MLKSRIASILRPLSAVVFTLWVCATPTFASAADRTLAVVGRQLFTERELDFHVLERRLFDSSLWEVPREELRKKLTSEAIDDYLLAGWAEFEVNPPPQEAIDARFQAAWARYEQLAGGPVKLRRILDKEGIEVAEFREWTANQARQLLLIRDAIGAYANLAGTSYFDAELTEAYRIRLAHILILASDESDTQRDTALEEALTIRRDIAAGFPFSQAARLHSEDSFTNENGGLLGWFDKDQLDPRLWDAAMAVPFNTVSQPIVTDKGIHLVIVLDYETPGQKEYYDRMKEEERTQLTRLRKETDIFLADGYTLTPLTARNDEPDGIWEEVEKSMKADD